MKKFLASVCALALLAPAPALAGNAQQVGGIGLSGTTCTNGAVNVGQNQPLMLDSLGRLCTNSTSGSGGTIGNLTADTHAQCSALCANLVAKNAAGTLKTFEVSADSTLSSAIWYVMVYDATSAPVDGAVTPAKCYQQPSGTTQMGGTLSAGGSAMTTGITIGVSSTGCFTKTASTHAFIAADYQ